MPRPIKVDLLPHDPRWIEQAASYGNTLAAALGEILQVVHHIGSTAIASIRAKPTVDLLPVVTGLPELDRCQTDVEALGYEWWGELGLPGRRYCSKLDPATGRRLVQLHFYAEGSPEITRHLAFRDYLLANREIADAYQQEKVRCQRLHPDDSHSYADCKNAWIREVEAKALSLQCPDNLSRNS